MFRRLLAGAVHLRSGKQQSRNYGSDITAVDSARGGLRPLGHQPAVKTLGSPLTWYACGPTVYDSAHLGHARTYVALDLLRRITDAYSTRPLLFAVGVTDIDDKILARAAERGMHPHALASALEVEFWSDMSLLRVSPPTAILRVTEHVDAIVDYITRIQANGVAYTIPGYGIYMDVGRLGTLYGDLGPEHARHGSNGQADGQDPSAHVPDAESETVGGSGKRDARDFALWKFSGSNPAPGSSWPSPWGPGRPGWHIECSAMTHAWCGASLDVHAGGVDLAFPHHCNEIAQAIAHAGVTGLSSSPPPAPWVGTWLHTGHLHIAGRKMSKSLKNFISVRELLMQGGAGLGSGGVSVSDAFRMFCAQHGYRASLSYAPERVSDGAAYAQRFREVVGDTIAVVASRRVNNGEQDILQQQRWGVEDHAFAAVVTRAQSECLQALTTDFDTPRALRCLSDCASSTSAYTQGRGASARMSLIAAAASAIVRPLSTLGFEFAQEQAILLGSVLAHKRESQAQGQGEGGSGLPPLSVASLVQLRSEVRAAASDMSAARKALKSANNKAAAERMQGAHERLLAASDAVRDSALPALGWRVKDTPLGPVCTPQTHVHPAHVVVGERASDK